MLVFATRSSHLVVSAAMKLLGIDFSRLSDAVGHA